LSEYYLFALIFTLGACLKVHAPLNTNYDSFCIPTYVPLPLFHLNSKEIFLNRSLPWPGREASVNPLCQKGGTSNNKTKSQILTPLLHISLTINSLSTTRTSHLQKIKSSQRSKVANTQRLPTSHTSLHFPSKFTKQPGFLTAVPARRF